MAALTPTPAAAGSNGVVWLSTTTWDDIVRRLKRLENFNGINDPIKFGKSSVPKNSWRDVMAAWDANDENAADVPAYSLVRLTDTKAASDSLYYGPSHVFNLGATYDTNNDAPFPDEDGLLGITPSGFRKSNAGKIVINGMATANVNILDESHSYAKPSMTQGLLESTDTKTNIRIVHSDTRSGEGLCKVLLGAGGAGLGIFFATMDENIEFGQTKMATMLNELNSPPDEPDEQVEVTFDVFEGPTIMAGKLVGYVPFGEVNRILWAECPDEGDEKQIGD